MLKKLRGNIELQVMTLQLERVVLVPTLQYTTFITLVKLLCLFKLQFAHLSKGIMISKLPIRF